VADNKYLVLQKLAEAAERPETEQMQVLPNVYYFGEGEGRDKVSIQGITGF